MPMEMAGVSLTRALKPVTLEKAMPHRVETVTTRGRCFSRKPRDRDQIDNDCDGNIDDGLEPTFYEDQDSDGFGNALQSIDARKPQVAMWQTTRPVTTATPA